MLTRKRDLRTGAPVWTTTRRPALVHQPLARDLETEILVIGAGISGALVAEVLTDAGLEVTVVDRRGPIAGSTAASTALLQHALDTPLIHLQRALGPQRAAAVWLRSRRVVSALHERSQRLGVDAELTPRPTLYLAGDLLDSRGLAREADARRRLGLEVELLGRHELRERYGLRRSAGLLGFGDWVAEPRKLAAGYLRAALSRGARVFCPTDVVHVHEHRRGIEAITRRGQRIRAKHAVLATGYEVFKGLEARGHSLQSTWVIATKPQPRALWPSQCSIWEASDPYLYLRTTSDGRVLCGGGDEPFVDAAKRDGMSTRKFAFLRRRLESLFPQLDAEPTHAWAGTFGASATGTPIIGRLRGKRRLYTVLGCGGNGITFSMLAAQLIRALVRGEQDSDAALFAPR